MFYFLITILTLIISTIMYVFLHRKTKIRKKFIYTDNIIVGILSGIVVFLIYTSVEFEKLNTLKDLLLLLIISGCVVVASGFSLTMIRFWRTPRRKISASKGEIVSPADGKIIYIRKYASGEIPVTIKNGLSATLNEILQTDLLTTGGWLIGINMTPFDVHKNCAPLSGEVILNKHIPGSFLSLKMPEAVIRNERNTLVIRHEGNELFGVVQTASKLVRRIDTYVKEGEMVQQGQWFGMIRFGSQVDILIPENYKVLVIPGQQVYAVKSVIAKK
jgi:phosphatidylserine decarboxylase